MTSAADSAKLAAINKQYREHVKITKTLAADLISSSDILVCNTMLEKYREMFLATEQQEAKSLLNYWYAYFIKVLTTTVKTQPVDLLTAWLSSNQDYD